MQPGAHGRVRGRNQYAEHVTIVRAKHWQSISNWEAVCPIMSPLRARSTLSSASPRCGWSAKPAKQISPLMPTLTQRLTQLESHGLIRLAAVQPELEYLFRHALVQDAAYASLVKADRKQLHLVVGEALGRLYPGQLASRELAPVLAQHFYQAGDGERALRYFTLAGDAAARVYANAEAAHHYSRALALARHAAYVDGQTLHHLFFSLGRALELSAQDARALDTYADAEAVARERSNQAMELAAMIARA